MTRKKTGSEFNKVYREENDLKREDARIEMTLEVSRQFRRDYPDRNSWRVTNLLCEEVDILREETKNAKEVIFEKNRQIQSLFLEEMSLREILNKCMARNAYLELPWYLKLLGWFCRVEHA